MQIKIKVKPDSQALSRVTFLLHSINSILVPYLLLKHSKNNLNWAILALAIRLPLNILII